LTSWNPFDLRYERQIIVNPIYSGVRQAPISPMRPKKAMACRTYSPLR